MKLFLNERPCKFLFNISKQNGKKNLNELGKGVYSTYKSKYELYEEMKVLDLIEVVDDGRDIIPYLTERGKRIIRLISEIRSM